MCVSMCVCAGLHFLFSVLPVEEILTNLTSLINPHVQRLDTLAHQEVRTRKWCSYSALFPYNHMKYVLDTDLQYIK